MGFGDGKWGGFGWGAASAPPVPGPPVIIPLSPQADDAGVAQSAHLYIRVADDVGVSLAQIRVTVNGVIWVLGGNGINGAGLEAVANAYHGWDLNITPPGPFTFDARQEVLVLAQDVDDAVTELNYFFSVGVGPRLVQVLNPFDNVLLAYFNQPMAINGSFLTAKNWKVSPVSAGAAALEITEVTAVVGRPAVAQLRYVGGGSTYLLTVLDLVSAVNEPIEFGFNSVEFEILFGDQEPPTIRLFNSIFGPLGIRQSVRTRRSMDEHVVNRAIALGLDEQFRLRMQQLDATAGRDGRPGTRRT
jgi:hypothetical protein